jgi:hypothetical protein
LFAAVLMLNTENTAEALGVTVGGENEHVLPAGRPEQDNETGLVKGGAYGPTGSMSNSYCAT